MKNLAAFLITALLVLSFADAMAQGYSACDVPCNWGYWNTGVNSTILINTPVILIDGDTIVPSADLEIYIGVFYDSLGILKCAGCSQYSGTVAAVTAWGSGGGALNGLAGNEIMKWKLCIHDLIANTTQEIEVNAYYDQSLPNTSIFVVNGMSSVLIFSNQEIHTPGFQEASFGIFPNPVQDVLYLSEFSLADDILYRIIDLTGRFVQSGKVNQSSPEIPVSSLQAGSYMISLQSGTAILGVKSFVKNQ